MSMYNITCEQAQLIYEQVREHCEEALEHIYAPHINMYLVAYVAIKLKEEQLKNRLLEQDLRLAKNENIKKNRTNN